MTDEELLQAYKDTGLEPKEVAAFAKTLKGGCAEWERLAYIAGADEQGRLVVLPCKVGDTVYALERFCDGSAGDCGSYLSCAECDDYKQEVSERKIGSLLQAVSAIESIGKTIFFTREEAEAALRKEATP